ncbi:hydrogenase expression/formation protein HypE [Geodermatophilus sp. YIM 151500]|uniref:hydrogenase expression/formation protein HypE n=1 Tax=Geodermatophilus sp. YIM 151500 TaxID=2984531 RepID=UPI0021E35DBB|nr:hydrogenase expression/formation protein HypE [Geodermatophilus sp. YIM 151500]MCV2487916.1 hydrogenase expression/formation protein HypE [Geodermatophilus sp. YIM 151500]
MAEPAGPGAAGGGHAGNGQAAVGGVRTTAPLDVTTWSCPVPLRDSPTVQMGHGGGGQMSGELVEHLFRPAFGAVGELTDSAVLEVGDARVAFSTDSFVVRPLFFPGGSIGDLAVNGTVNDLAMSGAWPLALSTAFIVEEGMAVADLGRVATALGAAARAAEVPLVTGDTKVVDAGHGDQVFVNTAGVGLVRPGVDVRPGRARPGDVVIVSGDIGRHGVAVLSCREGLEFGTAVESDTAPLHRLVAAMLDAVPAAAAGAGGAVHTLRDPTRGGVAAALNEIARTAGVGVELVERQLPVPAAVADACSLLGLDPLYVANEGLLVALVPPEHAEEVLAAMVARPEAAGARVVGVVVDRHPGMVVARTGLGGTRVVDLPAGEQLPRIC